MGRYECPSNTGVPMSAWQRVLAYLAAMAVAGVLVVMSAGPAQAAGLVHCNDESSAQSRTHPDIYVGIPFYSEPWWVGRGTYRCELRQGDRGNGVRRLQMSMNWCYGKGLVEDGIFGPRTRSA
jgi:hypothetical protein